MEVDVIALVRSFLLADTNVATEIGENVFGSLLPPNFGIEEGGIVLSGGGGDPHPEIDGWAKHRIQIDSWGETDAQARRIHGFVKSALHAKQKQNVSTIGHLVSSLCVTEGQDVVDEATEWFRVVSFFEVTVRPL